MLSHWKFISVSQFSENIPFEFSYFSLLIWIPCKEMQQRVQAKASTGRQNPKEFFRKLISVRTIELKHSENYTARKMK